MIDDAARNRLFAGRALEEILLPAHASGGARNFRHFAISPARPRCDFAAGNFPLGDITETGYETAMLGELSADALEEPPQIAPQKRHFQMMNMIARWADAGGVKLDTAHVGIGAELETLPTMLRTSRWIWPDCRPCARRTGR